MIFSQSIYSINFCVYVQLDCVTWVLDIFPWFLSLNKIAQFHNRSVYTTKTREIFLDLFHKLLRQGFKFTRVHQLLKTWNTPYSWKSLEWIIFGRSVQFCDFRWQISVRLNVDFAIRYKIRCTVTVYMWIKATCQLSSEILL